MAAPARTSLAGDDFGWVERTLDRMEQRYCGADGLLVTALDGNGRIADPEPMIADFGDALPFMAHFGRQAFVTSQLELARAHLSRGLYIHNRRVRLFYNHDWLLGLIELHRLTSDPALLEAAVDAGRTIAQSFFVRDLLIDEHPTPFDPRTWFAPASPFNGGYIELWLALYAATGDTAFLNAAERLGRRWIGTDDFRSFGLFSRVFCAWSPSVDRLLARKSSLRARLFKDNTNCLWGLAALHAATGDRAWLDATRTWMDGFEAKFLNNGDVFLWLDRSLDGQEPSLKAAFASIDLLCDLSMAGVGPKALALAETVAERWLGHQWPNGLFPETPGGGHDHLDANVDMAIALAKLSGLTGVADYVAAARCAAEALVRTHESEVGFVLSVDRDCQAHSRRIIVKYQALMLKLAIAPADPRELVENSSLLQLLQDR